MTRRWSVLFLGLVLLTPLLLAKPFGPSQGSGPKLFGPSGGGAGSGITTLNTLTGTTQTFATGTSGSDFAISSSGSAHTFNIPNASGSARGLVSTGAQTFAGAKTFSDGVVAAVTGNSSTATALAANPADCGSNQFATTIAANGDLTCSSVGNAATTATSANTNSAIVARDSSGNFTASTITANLTGNASTATALASNPSDCSAGQYASAIAASGNLTCANPFTGMIEDINGRIATVANATYILIVKNRVARQVEKIALDCNGGGTVTAKLTIDGVDITTCTGISVSGTESDTTCDTGSTNNLAADTTLALVTSSNSSCTDLDFSVQLSRD